MSIFKIKGRLLLWHAAISESQRLLSTALKCEEKSKDPELNSQMLKRTEHYHEYRKNLSDYEEGLQNLSHLLQFDKEFPKPFPEVIDYFYFKESFVMLATVIFCQMFNPGYKDDGIAFGNTKAFRDEHMGNIFIKAFPNEEEREAFNNLKDQIKTARNKMLGHADAESFQISHGEQVTSHKLYSIAIQDIDINYWISILEPLGKAILEYIREIEAEQ